MTAEARRRAARAARRCLTSRTGGRRVPLATPGAGLLHLAEHPGPVPLLPPRAAAHPPARHAPLPDLHVLDDRPPSCHLEADPDVRLAFTAALAGPVLQRGLAQQLLLRLVRL